MKRRAKAGLAFLAGSGLSYLGGSWLAARSLSRRLVSATGLAPNTARREELLDALGRAASTVLDFRHAGSSRHPVPLAAVFASPGEPAARPTILFVHGKGGSAAEWQPDALRTLQAGYNVLLPELRGHAPSGGAFVTYGLLEKEDLANAVAHVALRFGLDPGRLGLHSCSAGSAIALEFAASTPAVKAVWLESPYAEPAAMARHYLSRATRLPGALLHLTSRWAVRRALERIRRDLGSPEAETSASGPGHVAGQALGACDPRLRRERRARSARASCAASWPRCRRAARSGARRPGTATMSTRQPACCRPSTSDAGRSSSAAICR